MDVRWSQKSGDERVVGAAKGEYWRCTAIEPETRLRVGREIGQTETQAAIQLWQQVKQREAHSDSPPPILSDGWGGHREALVEVYGQVPAYQGRGRPPRKNNLWMVGITPKWSNNGMQLAISLALIFV